ncbi:PA2169 family four-helix-bundle protein [Daejeonella oryzae]|uniref:PA2169 family four-helix-bundle protein n=1 Tax=Daejeonella oryzae TaxID=1122943 RepID=UPI00042325DC|nr:PA2169 family four-helix-bundle protein [Daejeonella oryzae]
MENNKEAVEVLNDLVLINNDRVVGYERAIEETKAEDADLKAVFNAMIQESNQYKQELSNEIRTLGGEIESGTTNSGKIYRAWMDVKATFTGHSRQAVLENCEFGEDAAQKAYKLALEDEDLSGTCRELVSRQKQSLRLSHDKIKMMRDQQTH